MSLDYKYKPSLFCFQIASIVKSGGGLSEQQLDHIQNTGLRLALGAFCTNISSFYA